MIEFGKTLRTAREAKGLTTAQVAESTHMMIQIVEGLENEDFSRIVAPIYGRGFVKLYCEAVGLDPKDLIAEFMEIYNGNRPATIRVREVPPAAPQENVAPVATQPTPTQQMTVPPAQPERATREEPSLPHSGESSLFSTPSAPAKSDFAAADPLLDFPSTDEEPKKPQFPDSETGKTVPASSAFVPPTAGLLIARQVVLDLIASGETEDARQC